MQQDAHWGSIFKDEKENNWQQRMGKLQHILFLESLKNANQKSYNIPGNAVDLM